MLKGRLLEKLAGEIKTARVLPLFNLKYIDFKENWIEITKTIQNLFNNNLIIRSSSSLEDNNKLSNAGAFLSIPNVKLENNNTLKKAILDVFLSYGPRPTKHDEVLIQPMLENIDVSGVVFTADQDTLAPYYIINFDSGGNFDGVTSGKSETLKTYVHFKNYKQPAPKEFLNRVIELCKELETIMNNNHLDIEFAITKNGEIYLLQVRPLVTFSKLDHSKLNYDLCLNRVFKKIKKINSIHPNLLGKKSYLGVMPDWNPAEIIGLRPKKLSLSLYKELITDNIWAYQRHNYGYRNLRSHPLMLSLIGIPYIDVRTTFNSFIPIALQDKVAEKLSNYYLDRLAKNPKSHDKIEFDIVLSCYHFNINKNFNKLRESGFSNKEINEIEISLLNITNKILDLKKGLFIKDLKKIETLKRFEKKIIDSDLSLIDKIYWLIEYIKRYGTLPFAGVARAAFISIQMCKSLVEENIISEEEKEDFFNSLNTVSKKLSYSLDNLIKNKISKKEFLDLYGHLRPGTYDITTQRYDENFDQYFDLTARNRSAKNSHFKFSEVQIQKINDYIKKIKLKTCALDLINFIKMSIEGREYTKFIFSKTLSECIRLIQQLGMNFKISHDELAHLDIKIIIDAFSNLSVDKFGKTLKENINKNKKNFLYTQSLKLPSLILEPENIYSFFIEQEEPNYITLNNTTAKICIESEGLEEVENKIVFIKSADPGYDFLFSKNIAGLVTQFGGANSHMAIRCAELGIPAVIGAGEKLFNDWAKNKLIKIDCALKKVYVIT